VDSVRKVQLVQLEILKVFISICEKHHLRWYMTGGALIGVLRHKGFIPWDDDIDVGMPRRDFDKFISLQKEYPFGYKLINHQNDVSWQFNFAQFVDNESEIVVKLNEEPRKGNVWIDVFPIDGLPKNSFARWIHIKKILFYRYLIQIPNIRKQVNIHKVGRPWYEKVVIKALHYIPVSNLINVDDALNRMELVLKKYDFYDSSWAGNMLGRYREREAMKIEWWGEPVLLPFEDIMVNCPVDSDKIETKLYGDYMKWPAPQHRVGHDVEIIKLR